MVEVAVKPQTREQGPKTPTAGRTEKSKTKATPTQERLGNKIKEETAKGTIDPHDIFPEILDEQLQAVEIAQTTEQNIKPEIHFVNPDELTLAEVQDRVKAEDACKFLGWVRIKEADNTAPPETQTLRQHVQKLLADEKFLKLIAFRDPKVQISQAEIASFLGDSDAATVERAFYLLNYNIDPQLLLSSLAGAFEGKTFPSLVLEAVSGNRKLQKDFIATLDGIHMDNYGRMSIDSQKLSQVNNFIETCREELAKNPQVTQEQVALAIGDLEDVFSLHGESSPNAVAEALGSIAFKAKSSSANAYFELNPPSKGEWMTFSKGTGALVVPAKDSMRRHAEALEVGKYSLALYKNVNEVYKNYFPEVYTEINSQLRITDPNGMDLLNDNPNVYSTEKVESPACAYDIFSDSIVMSSENNFTRGGSEAFLDEVVIGPMKGRRRVVDTVTMAHELTHAMFDKRTGGARFIDAMEEMPIFAEADEGYFASVDHAIHEGNAVLMESLFTDVLIQNPQLLNLDNRDLNDLQSNKLATFRRLRRDEHGGPMSGYAEGTYRIFHRVYSEAAGTPRKRDMQAGLIAVNNFISGIDRDKTFSTKRTDHEYTRLLKEGTPEDWAAFFHK